MTRVVSYNILAGGYSLSQPNGRRTEQLVQIIRSAQPDVVGVIEATNPKMTQHPLVVEEMARQLGMQLIMGDVPAHTTDYQLALLTKLPVVATRLHARPGLLNKPLLEVCVEEADGQHLTIFVTHLKAAFSRFRGGDDVRKREMREILQIMAPLRAEGKPHLLMGDFNSLAPGEVFVPSALLRYVVGLDEQRRTKAIGDGHPHLDFIVPPALRFLVPLLRVLPRYPLFNSVFDAMAALYVARGTIRLLHEANYTDCYRQMHTHARGLTCPADAPAGRIDYIFASPVLSHRLINCYVVNEGDGLPGRDASDHLAVTAEYAPVVASLHALAAETEWAAIPTSKG